MESTFKFIARVIYVYTAIYVTWFLMSLASLALDSRIVTIDQEGIGMLTLIFFPISVVTNLVLFYLLSILEKTVLNIRFLLSATVISELLTFGSWILLKSDLAVVFVIHVLGILIYFFIWRLVLSIKE